MTYSSRRSGLPLWPILVLLLLAIRAPAGATQPAGAPPDTACGPVAANQPDVAARKPAWMWTLDERLAARFDPEAKAAREAVIRARVEAILKRQGVVRPAESDAESTGLPTLRESISGRDTPELFLPTELFDYLLRLVASAAGNQAARDWIEADAASLGCGDEFLDRFERAAAPYLELLYKDNPEGRFAAGSEDLRLCRERAQALESAKAEFGEEPFLRFLYEFVAPDIQMGRVVTVGRPGFPGFEDELRFREGGCR